MERLKSLPAADGFCMPGEFEPHRGCIMIWPKRPGSWPFGAREARKAFTRIAEAIADSEQVIMLCEKDVMDSALELYVSISRVLLEKGINHNLAWYDGGEERFHVCERQDSTGRNGV